MGGCCTPRPELSHVNVVPHADGQWWWHAIAKDGQTIGQSTQGWASWSWAQGDADRMGVPVVVLR